jgi:hypothetical protein
MTPYLTVWVGARAVVGSACQGRARVSDGTWNPQTEDSWGSKPTACPEVQRRRTRTHARTHHGCVEPNEGVEVDARADGVGHSH